MRLNPCINDSKESAIVNRVKAGDAGLGNRRSNHLGLTYKMCPWCVSVGILVKLDEQHVILECPGAGYARRIGCCRVRIVTLITQFLQVVPLLGVSWLGWFRIDPICDRSTATCRGSGASFTDPILL